MCFEKLNFDILKNLYQYVTFHINDYLHYLQYDHLQINSKVLLRLMIKQYFSNNM